MMKFGSLFTFLMVVAVGHADPCDQYKNGVDCSEDVDTGCHWCTNLDGEGKCVSPGNEGAEVMCDGEGGNRRHLRHVANKTINYEEENEDFMELEDISPSSIEDEEEVAFYQIQDVNKDEKRDLARRSILWTVAVDCHWSYYWTNTNTVNVITVRFYNKFGRQVGARAFRGPMYCGRNLLTLWSIVTKAEVYSFSIHTNGRDAFFLDQVGLFRNGIAVGSTSKNYCLSKDRLDHIETGWKRAGLILKKCSPKIYFRIYY